MSDQQLKQNQRMMNGKGVQVFGWNCVIKLWDKGQVLAQKPFSGELVVNLIIVNAESPILKNKNTLTNNQLLIKSMQVEKQKPSFAEPLFPITDEAELQELLTKPIQAKCLVFVKKQLPPPLTDKKQLLPILFQIHNEHVLQICPRRQKIISAFHCDYYHQFEIIRKPALAPGKVGEPQGIRICLKNCKPIECLIKPESKTSLEHFSKVLGHKYVVQLGFHNLFKAMRKIGKGMTACVYHAQCFSSGKDVAIKSFKRSAYFTAENNNGEISFKKQFKFLTKLNHKNICKFQGVFETENSTYVIMELLSFSLYGYLQKYGFPSEVKAKKIMKGLLEGIDFMHKQGIMHRDLKLENIMVKKDPQNPNEVLPVIVDLGLADYWDQKEYLYVRCGTPGYVAPEVLKIKSTDEVKTYNSKCDIFSLGIVFHILLFQKPVFEGKEVQEVVKKNCQCQINFESDNFKLLSEEGRHLFKAMLERNPETRISAEEALSHPYFTGEKLSATKIQSAYVDTLETIEVTESVGLAN